MNYMYIVRTKLTLVQWPICCNTKAVPAAMWQLSHDALSRYTFTFRYFRIVILPYLPKMDSLSPDRFLIVNLPMVCRAVAIAWAFA